MRRKMCSSKLLSIFSICLIVFFMYGCGAGNSLSSEGRNEFRLAKQEMINGNSLIALDHVFNAIKIDPEKKSYKKFVYKHFDSSLAKTKSYLNNTENTQDISAAEKRAEIYKYLVSIYSKVQTVELPFVDPKGKWEWTTQYVDYSAEQKASIEYAFHLIMNQAQDDLKNDRVEDSYHKFAKALDKYCPAEKRDEVQNNIVKLFSDYAIKNQQSNDVAVLELAYKAWDGAIKIQPGIQSAREAKKQVADKIAGIYYQKGVRLLASKDVEQNIKSIDQFKLAVKWNPAHQDAKTAIVTGTNKIAEYYYATARGMEKKSKADKAGIIAQYRNALKWIPEYKDAIYRIYSLQMGDELTAMKKNLVETRKQYEALTGRIQPISTAVDKSAELMNMLTYISDQTRSLDGKMKAVGSTLKAFNAIPVVGTVSTVTSRSLALAEKPVGGLKEKLDAFEKPFITPTKSAVDNVKNTVDMLKQKITGMDEMLQKTEHTVANIDNCIKTLHKEEDFKKIEGSVKDINKGLVGTNNQMKSLNNSLSSFETGAKALAAMYSPVSKIKNGYSKIKPTLDNASKVTGEMDKVLKKEFGFTGPITHHKYKMSLYKALTAGGKVAEKIADLGMKAAKPIMDKMKIKFPTVPGVDELKSKLNVVKSEYNNIQMQTNKIKDSYKQYTDFGNLISGNLNKIVKTTGCSLQVETNQEVATK